MNAPGERFDEATLATLEFPIVLEQIAAYATCAPGGESVRSLRPYPRREQAEEDLGLVDDAVPMFQAGTEFAFGGSVDFSDALERASVGGVLSGSELRDIARSERALANAAAAIKKWSTELDKRSEGTERSATVEGKERSTFMVDRRGLAALAAQRAETSPLVRRLETAIDDDGILNDSASPELARLRRQQRSLSDDIRKRVDSIVRDSSTAKLLTEAIVTTRGGRYVVPVRADAAPQFAGVVHGQSASGATVFVEPMACVEANNRLRGLEAEEEREIQRVLAELSALVSEQVDALRSNGALVARLDSVGARARWAVAVRAIPPRLIDATSVYITHGRHPLLRRTAVPLDVEVGRDADAVVISGPNMGGKTVVLKTIGLFCVLAHCGIPLPASAGTEVGEFDHIACIIGDEQSIANNLSSFAAHLRALRAAIERAGPRSLILVDEIGSGTEPGAGAALAQACVEALLAAGARVVVTTHYSQLKVFAASHDRVANASMLFDAATHEPTYILAMGVPGQSLAFALADSIGMDQGLVRRAETLQGEDAQRLEQAFANLADERERLREQSTETERELDRLRKVESELRERVASAEKERQSFERRASEALDKAIQGVRDELIAKAEQSTNDARRQKSGANVDANDAMRRTMADIRRSLGLDQSSPASAAPNAYSVGDRVYVRTFGQAGVVSEVYDRDVLVTMGSVKAVVSRSDLTRDPAATGKETATAGRTGSKSQHGESRMASLDASTS
ncbi:MAG TPA: MutS2/Smr-associated SH3 domain-containing protein, partial [Candidatus Eremiobacteraceae bacterium]|nr:MutS2/Smr-associated SH3 domain-containing protein [Candidatus Eremiobacteraceae bacterium]